MKIMKQWVFSIAMVYSLATSGLASADDILLRWHANIEPDLQGYNVYYGTQSRSYSLPIPVGKTTEHLLSNLDPGKTYVFAITAVDNAGNESAYSPESSVTIPEPDKQAPTVTITTPNTDSTFSTASGTLSLGGTADDDRALQTVTWSASDGQNGTTSGTTNWSAGSIQLAEGNTTFTVTATDAAGNKATDTLTVTYTPADTTNPTIAINTPTTDATFSTTSSTLSLGGTADDDRALQTVTWNASDGQNGTTSGTTNWSAGSIQLAEGNTTFTVTATDAAGNQKQDVITVSYAAVDMTSPSVVISSPTSDDTYTSDKAAINLAGSASDDVAVSQVAWSSSNGQSGKATGTNSWTIANLALSEGDNTITVTAVDTSGNTAVDLLTVTNTSDLTLSVYAYKVKGKKFANLTWSGGITAFMAAYRDGSLISEATGTQNDGEYIHGPFSSGKPATYKICEYGTSYCSNEVTVSW